MSNQDRQDRLAPVISEKDTKILRGIVGGCVAFGFGAWLIGAAAAASAGGVLMAVTVLFGLYKLFDAI